MMLAFEGIAELIPIAIGVLYVLGQISGIFGKGKKSGDAEEQEPMPDKPSVTTSPPRAAPRPPRGAKAPTPPRATPARPVAQQQVTKLSEVPELHVPATPPRARPAPMLPATPKARPAMLSPTPVARPQLPTAADHRQAVRPGPRKQPKRQKAWKTPARPERERLHARESIAHPDTAKQHLGHGKSPKKRRHRLTESEKLLRVLRSQSGTRAAIQLSEILAPPLALRDNHL